MGRSDSRCYLEEFYVMATGSEIRYLLQTKQTYIFARLESGWRLFSRQLIKRRSSQVPSATVNSLFSFSLVTEEEIKSIVLQSKNSSPGIDELPMLLFKENIDSLANIIANICNESFSQRVFPEKLAVALVTFTYKKETGRLSKTIVPSPFLTRSAK